MKKKKHKTNDLKFLKNWNTPDNKCIYQMYIDRICVHLFLLTFKYSSSLTTHIDTFSFFVKQFPATEEVKWSWMLQPGY